jgi:hypothetical protein
MTHPFLRTLPGLASTALIILLTACVTPAAPDPPDELSVTGVSITPTGDALILAAGETVQLEAVVSGSGKLARTVSWSSDSAGIASVDKSGLVTGISGGNATVTAASTEAPDMRGRVTITVKNPGEPAEPEPEPEPESEPEPAVTFSLTVSAEGRGSVSGNDADRHAAGTDLELTATAENGWQFSHWSGDLQGSTNPAAFKIEADTSITAVFTPDLSPCSDPEAEVQFGDEQVEAAVRQLYGIAPGNGATPPEPVLCGRIRQPVTSGTNEAGQETGNLLLLNRCDETSKNITSLEGLQHLTQLVRLELSCNDLTDISQLAGLTSLTELNLDFNLIGDLTPLTGLVELEVLGFYQNEVTDLTPLAGLTNLRILYASENRVSNLQPLAGLQNLEHLWLYLNCTTTEYSADDPAVLTARAGCLSDISPLAGLDRLESLILGINDVQELTAVSGMTQLRLLHASGNRISDISPLAAAPSLRTVLLDTNLVTSLSALADNPVFPDDREPFSFTRGSVRMPPDPAQPFPHLALGENCLDLADPATDSDFRELDGRATVQGFRVAQNESYRCGSSALQALQLQSGTVSGSVNEVLRQLRLSRSR